MERLPLIERVLDAHDVTIRVTGPWGDTTQVRVTVPDLRSAPRHVWGDWGPMHSIAVPRDRRIAVSVHRSGDAASHEVLDLDRLEVHSPASAARRALTPLVMKLPLARWNLVVHVFYDTHGRPVRAALRPMGGFDVEYASCQILDDTDAPPADRPPFDGADLAPSVPALERGA